MSFLIEPHERVTHILLFFEILSRCAADSRSIFEFFASYYRLLISINIHRFMKIHPHLLVFIFLIRLQKILVLGLTSVE